MARVKCLWWIKITGSLNMELSGKPVIGNKQISHQSSMCMYKYAAHELAFNYQRKMQILSVVKLLQTGLKGISALFFCVNFLFCHHYTLNKQVKLLKQ